MSGAVGKYVFIAISVIIAVGLSLYGQVHWFASLQNAVTIGRILGAAVSSLGISGIPFLLYWGAKRFRRQGSIFFALWAGSCAIVAYFALVGGGMGQPNWMPRDQYLFLQNSISSCLLAQSSNPLNKSTHVSDDQILRYCACFGQELANVISSSEITAYDETNRPPATLQEKIAAITPECRKKSQ
jgi:hypothetical protein